MSGEARQAAHPTLTIVGDDDRGVLAAALRRLGPSVAHRRVADLGPEDGPIVAVGMAASDGGATLRRRIGDAARLLVVLPSEPEGSAVARLEAFRHGADVIEASVTARTADAILERLEHDAPNAFGWVELGALIEAVGARVGARLGAGRSARTQLLLRDGRAVAVAVDRLADAFAELCSATKVASQRPIRVDDLSWDEDPQTMEADAGEIERWRRMAAKGPGPAVLATSVLGALRKGSRARDDDGLWAPSDSDRPPADDHREPTVGDEPDPESGRTPRTSTIREARRSRPPEEPPRGSLLAPPVPSIACGSSSWRSPPPPRERAFEDSGLGSSAIELPSLPDDEAAPELTLPVVLDPEESTTRATLPARPSARASAMAAASDDAIEERPGRGRLVGAVLSLLVLAAALAFLLTHALAH